MRRNSTPSTRAQVITRRTYNRPLDEEGTKFETWEETVSRVMVHQQWLWERAKGASLSDLEISELEDLAQLMIDRKVTTSGRTLWLGGTQVAKTREASQFNCSFGKIKTVNDIVDAQWLLLQGCGVGFEPVVGTLNGFTKAVTVEVIRSTLEKGERGHERNSAWLSHRSDGKRVWTLRVGDSAEAWAKAVGKLVAMKKPFDHLVLDFSQIRPAGTRLKGYGWISSGDVEISRAYPAIVGILNKRAGKLLTRIDILDIVNWMGVILSSRRAAEICVIPEEDAEAEAFAVAKRDHYIANPQRGQSNNSLLFYKKPTKQRLTDLFQMMMDAGGSEPGFINAAEALRRAPWFAGCNPCVEILLGDKSFCNLVEVDWGKFIDDPAELERAIWLASRANYRQTCVDLRDGILSDNWHELNEYLRLCGVGATGIVKYLDNIPKDEQAEELGYLRDAAKHGAYSMADDLGLPRPKNVTCVKPSGTLSKIMDTTEGVHKPLGRYIFNNVKFGEHDPLVSTLRDSGYNVFRDPYSTDAVLVTFPVEYEDVEFTEVDLGDRKVEVNIESAIDQLNRYKLMMDNYVDQNCSVTISYSPDEVPDMVDWLMANWDSYVGVSFLYRNDPTKTAEDLGYPYLPQEVVDKETFEKYRNSLLPINLDQANSFDELRDEGCATGACPIK
ncbi:ribonucleoside-triphosphate reductase, adenosylcobalamin-dependent [Pseudovibrio ascidiaceicola]|uniref:ribonucleoside-triphosphate reductase, adenosylcobalamin-dependent n=1 Tax=Pseudovibrio ascidiaceicola TaxID=285279 RepID=UPI003D35AF5E